MAQVEAASWCHQKRVPELRVEAPEKEDLKFPQKMGIYKKIKSTRQRSGPEGKLRPALAPRSHPA